MKSLFLIMIIFHVTLKGYCQSAFDLTKVRSKIIQTIQTSTLDHDSSIFVFSAKTRKAITNTELAELTNFPKLPVRMAALGLLVDRHYANIMDLLSKNRADTVQWCQVQMECYKMEMTFLDRLVFYLSPASGWRQYLEITKEQNDRILAIKQERRNSLIAYYTTHQN